VLEVKRNRYKSWISSALSIIVLLTGCYNLSSSNSSKQHAVYYPEIGAPVLFDRPAPGTEVGGQTKFSTLDGKIPFRMMVYFADGNDPRISIEIGFDNYEAGPEKIELDCSQSALLLSNKKFGHKRGDDVQEEISRAKMTREAWHLECINELTLYDRSTIYVYQARLLFWPREKLGDSFSIQLPIIKNHPQLSKPLVIRFVKELRAFRHIGGV
jgi:hypothetical protein